MTPLFKFTALAAAAAAYLFRGGLGWRAWAVLLLPLLAGPMAAWLAAGAAGRAARWLLRRDRAALAALHARQRSLVRNLKASASRLLARVLPNPPPSHPPHSPSVPSLIF